MTGPVFRAGRDIKGAFATAPGAAATANWSEQNATNTESEVASALKAIREILAQLPGIDAKALTRLDEAAEEIHKPNPKREEVQTLVSDATQYARDADGFADAATRLIPHLQRIAGWLDQAWQSWAPVLGLG